METTNVENRDSKETLPGKPNPPKKILSWFDAPRQAIAVGIWLLGVSLLSVFALISLFHDLHCKEPSGIARTFSIPGAADTALGITIDSTAARALCDTLAIKVFFSPRTAASVVGRKEATIKVLPGGIGNGSVLSMVLLAGALGASLFGLTSLADYVGNKKYETSWTLWYLLRPVIGVLLALVFYLIGRAGFFKIIATRDELYGVLAMAALVGLFSKQALHKLSDIFNVLFQNSQEKKLEDKLDSVALPVITKVDPSVLAINTANLTIAITGTHFAKNAVVLVNGGQRATTYKGTTALSATLTPADVSAAGMMQIAVRNPGTPEKTSAAISVEVK